MKSAVELVGPRKKAEKMKKERMKKFKDVKPYMSNWAKRKLARYAVKERENSIGDFNMK